MQVQVEDVGPCKKLLKIEVPVEVITEELNKTYGQLNENVVIPGFRRGRAPRWLMERRFGQQVLEDTRDTLIARALWDAVKEKSLHPLGEPQFDEEIKLKPGEPLSFGVTVEVRPEFQIEDYANIELEFPAAEATEAEIAERIEQMRRRYATLEELDKGTPQKDDVVLCRVTLLEEGAVYRETPNFQLIVGSHALPGLTVAEAAELVAGMQVGQATERQVVLPASYMDETRRGATMTLSVEVLKIRRPVMPEVTEEWLKGIGFDSVDQFRDEIRAAILREKQRTNEDSLDEQVEEQLLAKVSFELPEGLMKILTQSILERHRLALRYRGVSDEEIERHAAELQESSLQAAERTARLTLIMDYIAEAEKISATEEEVNARIEAMASSSKRSPEQVRRELEQANQLDNLRTSIRHDKVRAFLREKAKVKQATGPAGDGRAQGA